MEFPFGDTQRPSNRLQQFRDVQTSRNIEGLGLQKRVGLKSMERTTLLQLAFAKHH